MGLYGVAAIAFCWFYWQRTIIMGRTSFAALTYFHAETPFQYRILVPLMARGIEWLHPVPLDRLYFALTIAWTFVLLPTFARYLRLFVPPSAAARRPSSSCCR